MNANVNIPKYLPKLYVKTYVWKEITLEQCTIRPGWVSFEVTTFNSDEFHVIYENR